jgi:hypothetical protein
MIDDVQYLLSHSTPGASSIFVDSGRRNRDFYPTPSEYVVELGEPMRHVFGMDVLDAAMAGTAYNVEETNNSLSILTVNTTASGALAGLPVGVEDPERDALGAMMGELGMSRAFLAALSEGSAERAADPALAYEGSTRLLVLEDATPSLSAQSTASGPLDATVLSRRVLAGSRMTPFAPWKGRDAGEQARAAMGDAGADAFVLEHLGVTYAVSASGPHAAWLRDRPRDTYALRRTPDARTYDVVYFDSYRVHADALGVFAAVLDATAWRIRLEAGNYTVTSLLTQLELQMGNAATGVSVRSTSASLISKQGRLRFVAPPFQRMVIFPGMSTAAGVLGFDLRPILSDASRPAAGRPYNYVRAGPHVHAFGSVRRRDAFGADSQVLDAPGLVNLLGKRYITLRCPEIEQHMGQTGKYSAVSPGVGVFRLANASEVVQLRFDYVNLIRKPFHPIGQLSRLTLRFEDGDGVPYNFRGINHQLLLTIKYYVPGAPDDGGAAVRPILNPDYDPDFVRWSIRDAERRLGFESRARPRSASPSDDDDGSTGDDASEDEDDDGPHTG